MGVLKEQSIAGHPFEDQTQGCEFQACDEGKCCDAEEGEHCGPAAW